MYPLSTSTNLGLHFDLRVREPARDLFHEGEVEQMMLEPEEKEQ